MATHPYSSNPPYGYADPGMDGRRQQQEHPYPPATRMSNQQQQQGGMMHGAPYAFSNQQDQKMHQQQQQQQQHPQLQRQNQQPPPLPQGTSVMPPPNPPIFMGSSVPPAPAPGEKEKKESGPSDFIKRLFKMLEDQTYSHVVSWTPNGDSFRVKDMNEFTTRILPQTFRHSNFASFVRQLNKYDFHKVKNGDESAAMYGENSWEFKHPQFNSRSKDSLEFIKRKPPTQKKVVLPTTANGSPPNQDSPTSNAPYPNLNNVPLASQHMPPPVVSNDPTVSSLQAQISSLLKTQNEMHGHIASLTRNYQAVTSDLVGYQRNMMAQDQLMQGLVQYLVNLEAEKERLREGSGSSNNSGSPPEFVPSQSAQKLLNSYDAVRRASYDQMADYNRRMSYSIGNENTVETYNGINPYSSPYDPSREDSSRSSVNSSKPLFSTGVVNQFQPQPNAPPLQQSIDPFSQGPSGSQSYATNPQQQPQNGRLGPMFSTHQLSPLAGHDLPYNDDNNNNSANSNHQTSPPVQNGSPYHQTNQNAPGGPLQPTPQHMPSVFANIFGSSTPSSGPSTVIVSGSGDNVRVRAAGARSNQYVPGWTSAPRVLIVEDDAVYRKMSSKLLQVFGCTIDYAVDGVSAVNKMNVEKYDLVLMDIVMPNLDGISATSMIRQFDPQTPIISMTSNSNPDQIMSYMSHGMTGHLAKPFSKEGLLGMLEKHLIHMKQIQQLVTEIPRQIGVPPLSDNGVQDALTHGAHALQNGMASLEDGNIVNPFSSMGIPDDEYLSMLASMIAGDGDQTLGGMGAGTSKRGFEDDEVIDRDGKRGRFEIIE